MSMISIAAPQWRQTKIGRGGGRRGVHRLVGLRGSARRRLQQSTRRGEVLNAPGVGEQPVVADAMEAAGQHVQQEAAHELVGRERHGLVARACPWPDSPSSGSVTPRSSRREQPAVGDRHAVGVARQIGQHRLRARRTGAWRRRPIRTVRSGASQRRRLPDRPERRSRRRTATARRDAPRSALRGSAAGTVARARAPAGRSPAGRRSSARHRATGRRRARCRARADGASAPNPRCAAPGWRRCARPGAWDRRRSCSSVSAATSNSRP